MGFAKLRTIRSALNAAALLLVGLTAWNSGAHAQDRAPVLASEHGPNSPRTLKKHYVILVSLDGFRYDYAKKYGATNLQALASAGTSAPDGMIPSYPSLTFPNHFTLATGLYPEHHGIVANNFYDPARKQTYRLNDPAAVTDGSWYSGTPIWVLAEQQGMRAACFFWPGSEAEIQGIRPSYYLKYDGKVTNDKRVAQVLTWLRLPEARRPHLITLYFGDVDRAGHEYGPDSDQVRVAVASLDREIGALRAGLAELHLPVDLIVVSDHGMATVQGDWITLDKFFPDAGAFEKIVPPALYAKSEADAQRAYEALKGKSDKFDVYRRAQMPGNLHDNSNPRSGDPIIVENGPYLVRFSAPLPESSAVAQGQEVGAHGYDPARVPDVKASFFAAGPDIRIGVSLASFENVNVYPFLTKILGLDISHLKTGPIDGDAKVLSGILRSTAAKQKSVTSKKPQPAAATHQ
jgi:predicted AlkP superfamily pyrophosphatase or phosphodiesterase